MPVVSMDTVPHFPVQLIYDPANTIQGAGGANFSIISRVPRIISVSSMLAGTTLSIQAKVADADVFREIVSLDGAIAPEQSHEFDPRWNFVQLVRTGAQDMVAYAQS